MNVANIMAINVETIAGGKTVAEAMEILRYSPIKQLPVVDENKRVLGLLRPIKLLHTALHDQAPEGPMKDVKCTSALRHFLHMCTELVNKDVCEVMDREFVKVGPDVSVMEITVAFAAPEKQSDCALIVDVHDRLLGIISPWDIFKKLCNCTEKKL